MDETRFRSLMLDAIGEEPMPAWLPAHVRAGLAAPAPSAMRGRILLAIAVLTILLVVGVIEAQILTRKASLVPAPAATPSPAPPRSPLAVDPARCLLPVLVERGSGPPTKLAFEVGFVDTQTGQYTRDGATSVAGLPASGPSGGSGTGMPGYYSSSAHRWLPVGPRQVAPDGLSYAWVQTLPLGKTNYTSSELHRYNIASATDQVLWTYHGAIGVYRWDSSGILVNAGPAKGNQTGQAWWLVDPITGAVARHAPPPPWGFPPFTPLPGDPHNPGFTTLGVDADGHTIWWIYNPDRPGAVSWVFYETSPGHRVTIYRGTQGDATNFDPTGGALADPTGIWFADNEHHTVWHWRQDAGLRKMTLAGLPAVLSGSNSYVQVTVAGPCF